MRFQTCRRHPEADRFLATCSGCARELYDTEVANRTTAAARKALAMIGTPTTARIISAQFVGTGVTGPALVVVTEQPGSEFPYAVDAFRPATPDETDPERTDPRPAGSMVLLDQIGGYSEDDIPVMRGKTLAYLAELGFASRRLTEVA